MKIQFFGPRYPSSSLSENPRCGSGLSQKKEVPSMMQVKDIAHQENVSDMTVRKWVKAAGFELKRGRNQTVMFNDAQVKKIVAQKRAK